jgi:hypothetical protein
MTKFIFILTLLASAASICSGQVITTPEARSGLLDGMHSTLGNVDREKMDFKEVSSPFEARTRQEQVVATKELDNVPVRTVGALLPDDRALGIISQQFRPLGSLVIGDRGVLQLAGGRTIAQGASFKAEISGNIYEVQIEEVTSKGYTLSLGTASLSKNFLITTGSVE